METVYGIMDGVLTFDVSLSAVGIGKPLNSESDERYVLAVLVIMKIIRFGFQKHYNVVLLNSKEFKGLQCFLHSPIG